MSFALLLIGSSCAIALVSLLAGRLFPVSHLLDAERIERNLSRSFPDEAITSLVLSKDRQAALARLTRSDALGLVFLLGDRIVCRLIEDQDGTRITVRGQSLEVKLLDFTVGTTHLNLLESDMSDTLGWALPWLTQPEPGLHAPEQSHA